jgi:cyclic di-GMP phosphodiesterase
MFTSSTLPFAYGLSNLFHIVTTHHFIVNGPAGLRLRHFGFRESKVKKLCFARALTLKLSAERPIPANMESTSAKVLLVDDDPAIHRMIGRILRRHSLGLVSAHGGREALESVRAATPDIILLDVSMPGMDGFEVAAHVKADPNLNDIPIIIITGRDGAETLTRALDTCADDFISKTADPSEIIARVKHHLKRKHMLDQLHVEQLTCIDTVSHKTRQLSTAMDRLKEASLEVIWRLTAASEYRDNETGAHIKRMSHYSAAIARQMGLKEKTVETLLYAAPLHDIGKIGIPDGILLKPDRLNVSEWEIMKRHTTIGADILKGSTIGFVRMGETIARTHHEKWDGSGYPHGLKGGQIPLVGRIVALADVFDALTTKRPYKKAFSLEISNRIIAQGKGVHFDPDIVDAFFSIQGAILAIRERFQEEDGKHTDRR